MARLLLSSVLVFILSFQLQYHDVLASSQTFDDQHLHTRDFSRELGCFFVHKNVFFKVKALSHDKRQFYLVK
jgi:hypothetical protein